MELNLLHMLLFLFIIIFIVCPKLLSYMFLLSFTYIVVYTDDFVSSVNSMFKVEEVKKDTGFIPRYTEASSYKGAVDTSEYSPEIQSPDLLNPFANYSSDDKFSKMIQSKNDPNLRYKRPDYRKLVNEELNESESYPWWSKNEW